MQSLANRANRANELIETIADRGREFFSHPDRHGVSRFEVATNSRIWFVDGYTGKRIYLHYKYWGREFSEGGTLRDLVNALKIYIVTGATIPAGHFGPWPHWILDSDLWGYGLDNMETIRAKAAELGIVKNTAIMPK